MLIPKIIECFQQRFNKEVSNNFRAEINIIETNVIIWNKGIKKYIIEFSTIEKDIVSTLDFCLRLCKNI